ncbi:MAG: hypothetical protein EPN37_11940 [Chitinophagaceae bacterium]|nr:MAG: hypothetical protein EPN37_11940 [Chitinophagaceae bacterium]
MTTTERYIPFCISGGLLLAGCIFVVIQVSAQSFHQITLLRSVAFNCRGALEGFALADNRNNFLYTSFQEKANNAMLTRATDGKMTIAWNTASVPADYDIGKGALFLFLVDKDMQHRNIFYVDVNGKRKFSFGKNDLSQWSDTAQDGAVLSFYAVSYDSYGDARGYMTLYAPPSWLRRGQPLQIRIAGANENSNAWFMVFKTKDALAWLQSAAEYENYFRIHYTLLNNKLKFSLQAPPHYHHVLLNFYWNKQGQSVQDAVSDSSVIYNGSFGYMDGSAIERSMLKVYAGNKFLFVTHPFGKERDTTYTISNRSVLVDQRVTGVNDEDETISIRYSPFLGESLLSLPGRISAFYLMNSSHQDIAWMDSPAKCELMRDTLVITPLLKRLTDDPRYRFDMEDVLMIREYLHRHPDSKTLFQHFLSNGQLNVGGSFNMPYEDMYSGESLVREFYQGSLWMDKNFHYLPDTYWNVDVPGRTLQMPQILAKSGIKMMVLSRMEEGIFNWSAPDGSKVPVYSPGHYADLDFAFSDKNDISKGLSYVTGLVGRINGRVSLKVNEHTAIPLLWDMDMIPAGGSGVVPDEWKRITGEVDSMGNTSSIRLPPVSFATSSEIYQKLKNEESLFQDMQGERPDVWAYIHGPSHEWALHASRDGDILLPAAEKFATFNALLKGNFDQYPVNELHKAWEAKIYPDHGWGGKNGDITDNSFLQKFLYAKNKADNILNNSIEQIASQIAFRKNDDKPVVVFNSLSWKRDAPVGIVMRFSKDEAFILRITDAEDEIVPSQVEDKTFYDDHSLRSAKVYFIARQIPSLGFKTYYARILKQKEHIDDARAKFPGDSVFESDNYRIRLGNGGLKSVYDKQLHKELLDTHKFLGGEIFTMHSFGNGAGEFADIQKPDMEGFDKTSLHPCHWKIIADGPVFTSLQFRTHLKYADAQLTVILYKHLKRIDFNVDLLNWEGVLYREFRMAMPLSMSNPQVDYQVPFGILRAGQDELHRAAGERYQTDCRLVHPRGIGSWIGAYDKSANVTLSSDVAVADYIDPTSNPVSYTVLQPILLASRMSCNAQGNEYLQTGDHRFTFPFTSGEDDLSSQDKKGISNHVPLFVAVNPYRSDHPSLSESLSFLRTGSRDIIITAVKKAEEDDKVCVRFYNLSGKMQQVPLIFFRNIRNMTETNLIEKPLASSKNDSAGNETGLSAEKYGIETYTFSPGK